MLHLLFLSLLVFSQPPLRDGEYLGRHLCSDGTTPITAQFRQRVWRIESQGQTMSTTYSYQKGGTLEACQVHVTLQIQYKENSFFIKKNGRKIHYTGKDCPRKKASTRPGPAIEYTRQGLNYQFKVKHEKCTGGGFVIETMEWLNPSIGHELTPGSQNLSNQ